MKKLLLILLAVGTNLAMAECYSGVNDSAKITAACKCTTDQLLTCETFTSSTKSMAICSCENFAQLTNSTKLNPN